MTPWKWKKKSSTDDDKEDQSVAEDQIPELTQTIPVLDQVIPELTERIDLDVQPSAAIDAESSTDTVEEQLHRHRHEIETPQPTMIHVLNESVSNHELEMQQWQIEQQASIQAGEWQELANIESTHKEPALTVVADNTSVEPEETETQDEPVYLTDEVEEILHASWQRLENMIMTQMPPDISGAYLSLLEQQIYRNKVTLAKDLALLDQDSLDELLDEFGIDRGF